jgi:hypothetical protein
LGNVKFPNETLRLYFLPAQDYRLNDGLQNGAIRNFTDKSILLLDENTKKQRQNLVFLENNDSLWEQSISKKWIRLCLPMKTFAGFRLATVSLQYGERIDFLNRYLICFFRNKKISLSSTRKSWKSKN